MLRLTVFLAMLATVLSACIAEKRYDEREGLLCGGGDSRPWSGMKNPPSDAALLRELANKQTFFPKSSSVPREFWFKLPSGKIMLCRIHDLKKNLCMGEWWQFDLSGTQPKVSDQDGWICVP